MFDKPDLNCYKKKFRKGSSINVNLFGFKWICNMMEQFVSFSEACNMCFDGTRKPLLITKLKNANHDIYSSDYEYRRAAHLDRDFSYRIQ